MSKCDRCGKEVTKGIPVVSNEAIIGITQDFLDRTRIVRNGMCSVRPRLEMKSGLSFSVQAGYGRCSFPRHNDNIGPFTDVEISYPSEKIEKLMKYAFKTDNPTETVYPFVPIKLVDEIIEDNGGLKED